MDYSRRETLALGGGVAAGLLVGGVVGVGSQRRDGGPGDWDGEAGEMGDPPRDQADGDGVTRLYLVGTRDDDTVEDACDAVAGEETVVDLGDRRTLVAGPLQPAEARELARAEDVDYVEPDRPVTAADGVATSAVTQPTSKPWGIERVRAPAAHDAGYRGADARVAVLDSGVGDHPDLAPNLGDGTAFVDCEGDCSERWSDDAGHGTACAGVLGATGDGDGIVGVAPAVTIHPVKVLDADNAGRVSLVVEGLRWAVARGCHVANLSLSGPVSRAYDDALRFAGSHGTVVVASAGNVGPCENCINPLAAHPEAIAVTATDQSDELASFSATGPQTELAGPGVGVRTTGLDGYVSINGTSFAAPHVSGAAALCRSAGRSVSATRQLLTGTAAPLELDAAAQGNGLVDARSSVVPAVRTRRPGVDGREVTYRGSLPRLDGEYADVWFDVRWRQRSRWRSTPVRRRRETGSFVRSARLFRGLRYVVRARARFDDGSTVVGDRVGFRVPLRG
jgi:subtilisin